MTAAKNWNEIYSKAVAAGFYQEVMAAEENASSTVHVEKSRPVEEFDAVAIASLEEILSCSDSLTEGAPEFFKSIGIRW